LHHWKTICWTAEKGEQLLKVDKPYFAEFENFQIVLRQNQDRLQEAINGYFLSPRREPAN